MTPLANYADKRHFAQRNRHRLIQCWSMVNLTVSASLVHSSGRHLIQIDRDLYKTRVV